MARRDDRVDEAGLAASSAIVGRPITNIEKALMAHYLRHQQAGSPVRNQTVLEKGRRERRRCGGDAIDGCDHQLLVVQQRLKKEDGVS